MVRSRPRVVLVAAALAVPALAGAAPSAAQDGADPAVVGRFSAPFEEAGETCVIDADGRELCKPAGSTVSALTTGRVLYWDALEGTERVNLSIVAEAGTTGDSRSRVLDLSGEVPTFRTPTPADGGGDATAGPGEYLFPEPLVNDPGYNDGDLFCADQVQLADGRLLTVGGTNWYTEPFVAEGPNGSTYGVGELEGTKVARIFDPYAETWSQSGSMTFGRWYPSIVTLPDGDVLALSGVTKLLKPLYPERPPDSGGNVRQLERFDPSSGTWEVLPASADRSLPLYPRVHVLPNGHVYYDAAGQTYNPQGQSYDEAFWNIAASFDPQTDRWTDLGVPGLTAGLTGTPGFRGSAFSLMQPLRPDEQGRYTTAEFLSAGGVAGVTPGTYIATASSQINAVAIDPVTGAETLTSRPTGDLNQPRWYGTGVLLPTGESLVFSGADRDEVVGPGTGMAVTTPELFDPVTETWQPIAEQGRERTYHNTAALLPDGRVLVGGHAPISTLYGFNVTIPGGFSPNEGRDPSFEIYSPPYLFRGDRPRITAAPGRIDSGEASTFRITVASVSEAQAIADAGSVVLMRNSALTHLVDADQRSVVLPVAGRDGATLVVQAPPDPAVTPPGPYLLFANLPTSDGPVPSVARQVFVDTPVPPPLGSSLPKADPGQVSEPIEPTPPPEVVAGNLADALGVESAAVTGLAAGRARSADLQAARAVASEPVGSGWLVAIAAALPLAVLLSSPAALRRRKAPRRA